MIDWKPLMHGAGDVIKTVASAFGPIPAAIADFSVAAIEGAIEGVEAKQDPVQLIEQVENQVGELLARLKTGA